MERTPSKKHMTRGMTPGERGTRANQAQDVDVGNPPMNGVKLQRIPSLRQQRVATAPKMVKLFLDSGAYSEWARNKPAMNGAKPRKLPPPLNLKEYIRYCAENEEYLFAYVNMDVIPGLFGQKRSQAQVEESAKQGYANLQEMKKAGLKPVPVFHQGERLYWLEKMLDDGESYIGLSSVKESNSPEQLSWLDQIFSVITDRHGLPYIRTHGFGITNPPLLFRYPWTTTDSTTWSLTPGYGICIIPVYHNGRFDYMREPKRIIVSGITQKSGNKMQFEGMGPLKRAPLEKFIVEVAGLTLNEVRHSSAARRIVTLTYYVEFMKSLGQVRFTERTRSILHAPAQFKTMTGLTDNRLDVMFATSLSREWAGELNRAKAFTRLLSYYELRDYDRDALRDYVRDGAYGGAHMQKIIPPDWDSESYRNRRAIQLTRRLRMPDPDTVYCLRCYEDDCFGHLI